MKDEWKVYIKGVPGRGKEVIKMLEDLGGKKPPLDLGGDPSYIYYISHDGDIGCMLYESEVGKIIMDNYTELHLPEKWKDGDLLVSYSTGAGKLYAVYDDDSEFMYYSIIAYVYVDIDTCDVNAAFSKDRFKLASDEEHKEFHELLHKHGKDWDAENKILVDWKWKPERHEDYFFVYTDLSVKRTSNDVLKIDNDRILCGNCFRTREEAEAMAEKIKKLLKGE